jgi:carbonic anhydrase
MDEELVQLPWEYATPKGRLLLAEWNDAAAGCAALRPLVSSQPTCACEIRRVYVRPEFQGVGIGHALVARLIADARAIGYRQMLLNTLPSMARAQTIYRKLGFVEVRPYVEKPSDGVVYLALDL